jgi:hypothetical protein
MEVHGSPIGHLSAGALQLEPDGRCGDAGLWLCRQRSLHLLLVQGSAVRKLRKVNQWRQ